MHLFGLIAVTMMAFAANSVLTRVGVFSFGLDPVMFAGIRLASGAVMLSVLVAMRGGWPPVTSARVITAGTLLLYLVPFSVAYVTLPSGLGTLILFGVVQITMFVGSALCGTKPTPRQWGGMTLAMLGLGWLLWPSHTRVIDLTGATFMVVSGVGWGLFSLRGCGSSDPHGDMALSFGLCLPVAVVLIFFGTTWAPLGVVAAIIAGAVTSGLGYALWYRVLPQIAATTGAVAQLSVPVIAIVAGAVVLSEAITVDIALASAVVLGGIAVAVIRR